MRVNFAHVRERAAAGGDINFVVFDGRSASGSSIDNDVILTRWTSAARSLGLLIDQSALAFLQNGRIQFYGSKPLVEHLARTGLPSWTNFLEA
jgi:hypothetical protein